jgi:hypothetical protein
MDGGLVESGNKPIAACETRNFKRRMNMESTTNTAEPKTESASTPLTLFRVTLDWNPNNSDEGTYSSSAWATGYDAAIYAVAEEMSQHPDAAAETQAQKECFVQNTVRNAQSYAGHRASFWSAGQPHGRSRLRSCDYSGSAHEVLPCCNWPLKAIHETGTTNAVQTDCRGD